MLLPALLGLAVLGLWEALVAAYQIPRFRLPAPSAIWQALIDDFRH
jgi:ABC-type nitrate/sulfonate/bicarbonate transport system permease component